jgi:hypothetical protein
MLNWADEVAASIGWPVNSRFQNEIHIHLFPGNFDGKTLSKGTALINPTFD